MLRDLNYKSVNVTYVQWNFNDHARIGFQKFNLLMQWRQRRPYKSSKLYAGENNAGNSGIILIDLFYGVL